MNIETKLIRYYVQDDEYLKEYLELYEILKPEHRALIDKRMSSDISDMFYQLGYYSKSKLIKECNSIKFLQQCTTNEDHKHWHSSFCRDRFCPICSHIKSHVESEMLQNVISSLRKDNNYKNSYLIFITFTQKNVGENELADEINKINGAIKKWLKTDDLFKDHKVKVKDKKTGKMKTVTRKALCQGTVRHLEVTSGYKKGKGIEHHPHIHICALVKKSYFSKTNKHLQWTEEKLWTTWRELLDLDYNPNVDIRLVKNDESPFDADEVARKNNLDELDASGVVKEICKYSTKDTDIIKFNENDDGTLEINWTDSKKILKELYISLKHKRLLVMTGAFKKTKERLYGHKESDDIISEKSKDDLIQIFKDKCKVCGSPVTEHIYLWRNKDRGYVEGNEEFKDTYKKSVNCAITKKSKKNTNVSDQTNISIPAIS